MPRWLIPSLILSLALVFLVPASAHAEDKAKALKLLAKGDALLDKGDRFWAANKPEKGMAAYEEALAVYNEAHEAFPSAQIYYPIARAEQKLGQYLEAMRHYQMFLKEAENPKPELVEQVDASIVEVLENLSGLELSVEQEGAEVQVDGKTVGKSPLKGTRFFAPGKHKYTITLEGHTPIEVVMETKGGEVVVRHETLVEMPVVVKPKGDNNKKSIVVDTNSPNQRPLTISFGIGGAFLLGATFTAIQAKTRHDRFKDESKSNAAREAARDRGKTYRLATDVLLGGAVVAIGYGTYYYYSTYKPNKEKTRPTSLTSVWVSPYATSEGGGVAMGAQF